jgi:hypothetical protein
LVKDGMGKTREIKLGQKYHFITVIDGPHKRGHRLHYDALCDCGEYLFIEKYRIGKNLSCGCRDCGGQKKVRHKQSKTKTYQSWLGMKTRCHNPDSSDYCEYGARGISVCSEWIDSFETFLKDMGQRPSGHTLDRIDPNGNYTKENCRWSDLKKQNQTKRKSLYCFYMNRLMSL